MTFQRIDLLPRYDLSERNRVRSRWESEEGRSLQERIVDKIRKGAGEDFLQWDFESGRLGFIEDQWDLAGIHLFNENITFPTGDNFENIDFSYSQFWHSTFIDATFPQTHFSFARLYNIEFRSCLFAFAHFYGCTFENCRFINCDFAEVNGFSNCELLNTQDCFFNKDKFVDCKFDERVEFEFKRRPQIKGLLAQTNSAFKCRFEKEGITGIYRGITDGYSVGQVYAMAREYTFRQQRTYTRFNRKGLGGKIKAYTWELTAGYGLRPARVLICLVSLFAAASGWFAYRLENIQDGLILSAGAFLTFGARTELLQTLPWIDRILYIFCAFCGVALTALFVTVLANVLLRDN